MTILIIILSSNILSVRAFWPLTSSSPVTESLLISKNLSPKAEDTRIVLISDAFLYPVPSSGESFAQPPTSKIGIMYRESQVLLQEAIRDILTKINDYDLVLFTGSMVANQEHYPLFEDISYELTKYGLDYYTMIGYGETTGTKPAREIIKKPYYLLETEGINLLVLDNVSEKLIPERLPEEASEQYIWLQETLKKLNENKSELYIFSYNALDKASQDLIANYPDIKIIAYFNSASHGFSVAGNQINNTPLSIYPCAYTIVERSKTGELSLKLVHTKLRGVKNKAKQALAKS